MDNDALNKLLADVASGALAPEDAVGALADLPFAEVSSDEAGDEIDARLDHHRAVRCGFPEVILCQGKSPEQVRAITRNLLEHGDVVLATRAEPAHFQALARVAEDARYNEQARLIIVDRRAQRPSEGHVVVASAGTADVPVAEEAALCAEVMGNRVTRLYDVGVAGVHRVLAHRETLRDARVLIAVAGMEGALPSLVAGLVDVPVVAVPTSVGYGAHFGGVAPLLTMLNSCAGGIGVVNIDNGFGAAMLASRINRPSWVVTSTDSGIVEDAERDAG
jgi:pyridinium-3,5-biscarboxylic acid mononucleotide synthase